MTLIHLTLWKPDISNGPLGSEKDLPYVNIILNLLKIEAISELNKNLTSNLPFGQESLKVFLPKPISHLAAFKKFKVINHSRASQEKNVLMTRFFPSVQRFLK